MGEGRSKRHRSEKEARKILKKLRKDAEREATVTPVEEKPPPRRVYGPARPPPQSEPDAEETPVPSFIGPELPEFLRKTPEPEEEMLVGPELPENWMEGEQEDVQESGDGEVERILALVKKDGFVDPYEILGISADRASDAAVKKAYWKRSLSVHPDKNAHPQAQKAFQALNQAWKQVQSAEHRLMTERKREDVEMQRQAEIAVKKERRQQEWTNVMHPGAKRVGLDPSGRQEWMTQLPELRRKPAIMKQVNQTSFSRKEYADVTNEAPSSWTDQPQRQTTVPMGPTLDAPGSQPEVRKVKKKERVSLMEKHQRQRTEESKKSEGKNKAKGAMSFEYRPFDREKDLDTKRQGDTSSMFKKLGTLNERFT